MVTYRTLCSSDNRAEWLEQRKHYIGASDIAAILGISPFQSAYSLWLEKTGQLEREEDPESEERMFWGLQLESAIIDGYGKRAQRPVRHVGELRVSTKWPWMAATLDGETMRPRTNIWSPLEVKNQGFFMQEQWVDGVPDHYHVQVQQQMLVNGLRVGTAATLIGGQQLAWADVDLDDIWCRRIIRAGQDFVYRVENGIEPELDGSKSTHRALARRHPSDNGDTVELDGELLDLTDELVSLKAESKDIESKIGEYTARLKHAIGPCSIGILPNGNKVTWKKDKRGVRTLRLPRKKVS